MKYKMGVVGLGVMGASLARNIESKGFPVVGYDLDKKKMQGFLDGPAKGKAIAGADRQTFRVRQTTWVKDSGYSLLAGLLPRSSVSSLRIPDPGPRTPNYCLNATEGSTRAARRAGA